jgi:hypothetical protein
MNYDKNRSSIGVPEVTGNVFPCGAIRIKLPISDERIFFTGRYRLSAESQLNLFQNVFRNFEKNNTSGESEFIVGLPAIAGNAGVGEPAITRVIYFE